MQMKRYELKIQEMEKKIGYCRRKKNAEGESIKVGEIRVGKLKQVKWGKMLF